MSTVVTPTVLITDRSKLGKAWPPGEGGDGPRQEALGCQSGVHPPAGSFEGDLKSILPRLQFLETLSMIC